MSNSAPKHFVAFQRQLAGQPQPFGEAGQRELAGQIFDWTRNMAASLANHNLVGGEGTRRQRLGEIAVPTLVFRSSEARLFPPGHGEALARAIPNARFVLLEHAGHELPQRAWKIVIPAIAAHTEMKTNA